MQTESYTAQMDDTGTYSVYADGVLVAEGVRQFKARMFLPESPEFVSVRLPSGDSVKARVTKDTALFAGAS